jgi:hypothetical protein
MPGGREEREKVCVDIEALVVRTPHYTIGSYNYVISVASGENSFLFRRSGRKR